MEIVDNFLDQQTFNRLQDFMLGGELTWHYFPAIMHRNEITDQFQFVHPFYLRGEPIPNAFLDQLTPILKLIDPMIIYRILANLRPKTPTIVESLYHVDICGEHDTGMEQMSEEKLKQWTTSILYINTNNGYTKFEDGTKVECVANRFVTFPTNIKHCGTSCTDEKTRVIINFNYFK